MKTEQAIRANRLLEVTWGMYGIHDSIQRIASRCDEDDDDTKNLYNLSCAMKVMIDCQHELTVEILNATEGDHE